jgi:hypothetical protein
MMTWEVNYRLKTPHPSMGTRQTINVQVNNNRRSGGIVNLGSNKRNGTDVTKIPPPQNPGHSKKEDTPSSHAETKCRKWPQIAGERSSSTFGHLPLLALRSTHPIVPFIEHNPYAHQNPLAPASLQRARKYA